MYMNLPFLPSQHRVLFYVEHVIQMIKQSVIVDNVPCMTFVRNAPNLNEG